MAEITLYKNSVSAVAKKLNLGWDATSTIAINAAPEMIYRDLKHLAGVTTIGVDEHIWNYARRNQPNKYITIIADLTKRYNTTGTRLPARLLDMAHGHSKHALQRWLELIDNQPPQAQHRGAHGRFYRL